MTFIAYQRFIQAPVDHVYATLTSFDRYSTWNSNYIGGSAPSDSLRVGSTIRMRTGLNTAEAEHVTELVSFVASSRLEWRPKLDWPDFLIRAKKIQTVESTEGGTIYRVKIIIEGLSAGVAIDIYGESIHRFIKEEADALKMHIETTPRPTETEPAPHPQ